MSPITTTTDNPGSRDCSVERLAVRRRYEASRRRRTTRSTIAYAILTLVLATPIFFALATNAWPARHRNGAAWVDGDLHFDEPGMLSLDVARTTSLLAASPCTGFEIEFTPRRAAGGQVLVAMQSQERPDIMMVLMLLDEDARLVWRSLRPALNTILSYSRIPVRSGETAKISVEFDRKDRPGSITWTTRYGERRTEVSGVSSPEGEFRDLSVTLGNDEFGNAPFQGVIHRAVFHTANGVFDPFADLVPVPDSYWEGPRSPFFQEVLETGGPVVVLIWLGPWFALMTYALARTLRSTRTAWWITCLIALVLVRPGLGVVPASRLMLPLAMLWLGSGFVFVPAWRRRHAELERRARHGHPLPGVR